MRHPPFLVVLVAAFLLAACDSDWFDFDCGEDAPLDLTVHFTGSDPFTGQQLSLRVTGSSNWNPPDPDPYVEICRTSLVIPAAEFSIHETSTSTSGSTSTPTASTMPRPPTMRGACTWPTWTATTRRK
jgi:hypothetical protein